MVRNAYIHRQLLIDGRPATTGELVAGNGVFLVLAEPGAGKTELLDHFAIATGARRQRANIFRHTTTSAATEVLIIDALDEVARLDTSAIDQLIVKAYESGARRLILAGRSAQWNEARNAVVRDCFGQDAKIVRLLPFSTPEQEQLFSSLWPDRDFAKFQAAVASADLTPLLGNPQFLILFANAYVGRGEELGTKHQVFQDAIAQLATETNQSVDQKNRPAVSQLTTWASDVYAKLLLSGASGVSVVERGDRDFPFINLLSPTDAAVGSVALETGLFKPADSADDHEPIHRMVAEYAAAEHLIMRINDVADSLTADRCVALIAPNRVVREELRGLFGWMAALALPSLQHRIIKLDPYAVLTNGDPSRLSEASKELLLEQLAEVAQNDPYFRGADIWRTFSATGFFTDATVDTVRRLLTASKEDTQLRSLLLELIKGSPALSQLQDVLCNIMVDPEEPTHIRMLCAGNLIDVAGFDCVNAFDSLVKDGTENAVTIAALLVQKVGLERFGRDAALQLFAAIDANFFPDEEGRRRGLTSKYFIKTLVDSIASTDLVWLVDRLSDDLSCSCGAKHGSLCRCRDGRSHIIGHMLDRLFRLDEFTPTAEQLWKWTKNLNFKRFRRSQDSASVDALQTRHELRQSIHELAFRNAQTRDDIFKTKIFFTFDESHSGLHFSTDDIRVLVDRAFQEDNVLLWQHFIDYHPYNRRERVTNDLRSHMRAQAREKPEFMRAWAIANREHDQHVAEIRMPSYRRNARIRRRDRREREIVESNQRHFEQHRAEVEAGQNWPWLQRLAEGYLRNDPSCYPEFDDPELPQRALRNSFEYLAQHLPTLEAMAETNGIYPVVKVLHAACLAEYRATGTLRNMDPVVLQAVKTQADIHYTSDNNGDREAFSREVTRCAFREDGSAVEFCRRYFDAELAVADRQHCHVHWLRDDQEFNHLRPTLPLQWLENFPDLSTSILGQVFDIAIDHGDRARVVDLVRRRCASYDPSQFDPEHSDELHKKRDFWMLRKFLLEEDVSSDTTAWLMENRDRLLQIQQAHESFRSDDRSNWIHMSASKILTILEIFTPLWPAVELPSSWGTGDPPEETAYRFLRDVVWRIRADAPEHAFQATEAILSKPELTIYHPTAQTIRAEALRRQALVDYTAPTPTEVTQMLEHSTIATVEDLRAFMNEQLHIVEDYARGSPTDWLDVLYKNDAHVDENDATKRIVERLDLQCQARGLSMVIEHHMRDEKRCDITVTTNIGGTARLLVIEVKGQWHKDLYTAASAQLHQRYTIHPNAEGQGIYLVLWFGPDVQVAGRKNHGINSADELRERIYAEMPADLKQFIDVVVLDLSRSASIET